MGEGEGQEVGEWRLEGGCVCGGGGGGAHDGSFMTQGGREESKGREAGEGILCHSAQRA